MRKIVFVIIICHLIYSCSSNNNILKKVSKEYYTIIQSQTNYNKSVSTNIQINEQYIDNIINESNKKKQYKKILQLIGYKPIANIKSILPHIGKLKKYLLEINESHEYRLNDFTN